MNIFVIYSFKKKILIQVIAFGLLLSPQDSVRKERTISKTDTIGKTMEKDKYIIQLINSINKDIAEIKNKSSRQQNK